MKGDIISDHFLMLWFQKDSLFTVSFGLLGFFGGGGRSGLFPKFYHFLLLFPFVNKCH